jgi:putative ABC transport system permease protein
MKLDWFRRRDREAELDAEIRSHLDQAIRDRIARGEAPDEARASALREFGNVGLVKEVTREMWGWAWLEPLMQDLRFGLRMLRKHPGFTLIAVLSLALGIGANTAIFSVVNAVLLRPLPYAQPEQLVSIYDALPSINFPRVGLSEGEYINLRNQNQSFVEVAARYWGEASLRGVAEPERIIAPHVSANYFRTLGVRMALGRDFLPVEELTGKNRVIVLTHQFWQRKFAGDPDIIGRTLTLDESGYTVIGILPADFRAPHELSADRRVDVWRAYDLNPARLRRGNQGLTVFARLRPGVTLETAHAETSLNTRREATAYPVFYPADIVNHIEPLQRAVTGDVRRSLWMLLAAVGVVLLIVCANIASLLLVKGEERQKEIAVRAALGAGRGRIVRQMLTESTLLALLGGGLGLLIAHWGIKALVAISPDDIPRLHEAALDLRVLGAELLVSLLTALFFGLAPALYAVKFDLNSMLKESGRGAQQSSRHRLRKAMVVIETALAVVLLVAAGLLLRSFRELHRVNTGFRPDHLLTVALTPPSAAGRAPQQVLNLYDRVMDHLQTLPGVTAVAAAENVPLAGSRRNTIIEIAGRALDMTRLTNMSSEFRAISTNYFQTTEMRLLRGRGFEATDQEDALPIAIINESLARNHWPNENPISQRFRLLDGPPDRATTRYLTIVGVVADAKNVSLTEPARQEVFIPIAQKLKSYGRMEPGLEFSLVIRTATDPAQLAGTVQRKVRELDNTFIITQVRTMEQILTGQIVQPRFNTILVGCFALLALALGVVGIYGVLASVVAQRTQEIGIRLALGAQTRDVLRLVLGEGMRLSGLGVGLGLLAAFALTRLLRGFLFGVSATDPLTFFVIALLLLVIALLACWIPAQRATKVDPMIALRTD